MTLFKKACPYRVYKSKPLSIPGKIINNSEQIDSTDKAELCCSKAWIFRPKERVIERRDKSQLNTCFGPALFTERHISLYRHQIPWNWHYLHFLKKNDRSWAHDHCSTPAPTLITWGHKWKEKWIFRTREQRTRIQHLLRFF